MNVRERRFDIFVGSPGSGKTTSIAKAVKTYTGGNVCFYKHLANIDDKEVAFLPLKTITNWRQGVPDHLPAKFKIAGTKETYKEFLNFIKNEFRNGLLVIDDATIFERDRLTEEMNYLVAMRRHLGIDIWLVYHGMTLLPIEQFLFLNRIVIFNTNDNMKYKANKIPQINAIEYAVKKSRQNYKSIDKKIKYKPTIIRLS